MKAAEQSRTSWGERIKRTAYWVLKRRDKVLEEKDGLRSACVILCLQLFYLLKFPVVSFGCEGKKEKKKKTFKEYKIN